MRSYLQIERRTHWWQRYRWRYFGRLAVMLPLVWLGCLACAASAGSPPELELREQEAFRHAVEQIAPAVVRIETIGGLERVSGVLMGTGPTSGVVVDPDGYIVSSAFAFANRPASILVRLPDGTRKPAELVATDHSRMLVLLKIETHQPLPVPDVVPEDEIRVGQWAIAVGRTFDPARPNMTVGIISARERIWGKAIQTDAIVSPNNYGGALIDIRGRLLGVIVPLSPQSADEVAGVEWYDSGIGFAVPGYHLFNILPKWKHGQDLHAGLMGISLAEPIYTAEPVIRACRPGSPAYDAGLKPGDKIVEIDGRPVRRAAEAKQQISRRYAGEKVHLVVLREEKRLEFDIELVARLEPYEHPFLGVLPRRDDQPPGVTVRYVYPESPAARAGIEPGDVLRSLAGEPIKDRHELAVQLSRHKPGQTVKLRLRRSGEDKEQELEVVLARLPEDLPPEQLPEAHAPLESQPGAKDQPDASPLGLVPLKVPEMPNEAFAYVPAAARRNGWCGLVVWIGSPGPVDRQAVLGRWKTLCEERDLILLVPQSRQESGWQPVELRLVQQLIDQLRRDYPLDPARMVVAGYGQGVNLAWLTARRHPELVRAAVVVEATPAGPPPQNDPTRRFAVFATVGDESDQRGPMSRFVEQCRSMKVPVTLHQRPGVPGELDEKELAQLLRWIDMLDRI